MQCSTSVALCTYNSRQYLPQQLDSILRQTTPVNEIVVIDDASADNTLSLLDDYATRYPGLFRIIRNERNRGARKNFERLLSLCRGDVIFLSDHDDVWREDKVQTILTHFENNPADQVVFTNASLIDSEGNALPATLWDVTGFPAGVRQFIQNRDDLFRFLLKHGRIVTGATLAVRKDFTGKVLPFRLMRKIWHDAWIAVAAAHYRVLSYIDQPLIHYRVHKRQQVGWENMQKLRKLEEGIDLVPALMKRELRGQCSEDDLAALVHLRRKRVRFINRLGRFLALDRQITDEIRQERMAAEIAYAHRKPLYTRIMETVRKLFN